MLLVDPSTARHRGEEEQRLEESRCDDGKGRAALIASWFVDDRWPVKYPPYMSYMSDAARDLISRLLERKPVKRIGMLQGRADDIKRLPWSVMYSNICMWACYIGMLLSNGPNSRFSHLVFLCVRGFLRCGSHLWVSEVQYPEP